MIDERSSNPYLRKRFEPQTGNVLLMFLLTLTYLLLSNWIFGRFCPSTAWRLCIFHHGTIKCCSFIVCELDREEIIANLRPVYMGPGLPWHPSEIKWLVFIRTRVTLLTEEKKRALIHVFARNLNSGWWWQQPQPTMMNRKKILAVLFLVFSLFPILVSLQYGSTGHIVYCWPIPWR